MLIIFAVAVGGAFGSIFRYLFSKFIQNKTGIDFPFGTLIINVSGSFLIGLSFSLLVERISASPEVRALIITGFLGGFTTFSTFSYESYNLLIDGENLKFLTYIVGTNFLSIATTIIGYNIGRLL